MSKQLSEKEVLKKLSIPDFRHLSKNNVMQFASMLNDMDPDVAKKAIEQFPNFATVCKDALSEYGKILEKAMESNKESMQEVHASYNTIMDVLSKLASKENITFEERKYYLEQMKEIAEKMGKLDKRNKNFILKIAGVASVTVLGVVGLCATLLGGNSNMNIHGKK